MPDQTVDEETPTITIRWRRYGRGGKWRADLPPGNGIDSGNVESSSLETVKLLAADIAGRYSYRVVTQERSRVDA